MFKLLHIILSRKFRFDRAQNCRYAQYKPRIAKEKTLFTYRKLKYFLITSRLQRLFMSLKTIEYKTWHHSYDLVNGVIVHSFNGEAWKQFYSVYPQFSIEWIQSIWIICCTIFLLAGNTHNLYLATRDMYEVKVHVTIYDYTVIIVWVGI